MGSIEWTQVVIAFIAGVLLSAMVKGWVSAARSKVGG
jgi:hypothetical protein